MIRAYIFTYGRDAECGLEAVRSLLLFVPGVRVYVIDDAGEPWGEGARRALREWEWKRDVVYRRSEWSRGGNLRGGECIRGMLGEMGQCGASDVVVKVDSDTVVLDGGFLGEMRYFHYYAAGYKEGRHRAAYGNCYAMSGQAVRMVARRLKGRVIGADAPEDLTIFKAAWDLFGEEGCRLVRPWSPDYRLGRWSWWNWDSATASAEKYARAYDVVSVGNPRPPHIGAEERAVVMRELIEAKRAGAL